MKTKLIVDLDGTLAINDHRQHFLKGGRKDWDSFFEACDKDQPNTDVIDLVNRLAEPSTSGTPPLKIFILSGRIDSVRQETTAWLDKFVDFDYVLLMRPSDDRSPDIDFKRRLAADNGLVPESVLCVIDDRSSVVAMWREEGYTVLQVADHNY